MADSWPAKLTSSEHVGRVLDWARKKTDGNALVMVAIGVNSIVISKDPKLDPEDAVNLLADEMPTISAIVRLLGETGKTHGGQRRPDR